MRTTDVIAAGTRPARRTSPSGVAAGLSAGTWIGRHRRSARATPTRSAIYSPRPTAGRAARRRDRDYPARPLGGYRRSDAAAARAHRRRPAPGRCSRRFDSAARSQTSTRDGRQRRGCDRALAVRAGLRAGAAPRAGAATPYEFVARVKRYLDSTVTPTTRTRRAQPYPLESFLFRDKRLLPAVLRGDGAAAAHGRRARRASRPASPPARTTPRPRSGSSATSTRTPGSRRGSRIRLGPVRPDAGRRARPAAARAAAAQLAGRRRRPRRRTADRARGRGSRRPATAATRRHGGGGSPPRRGSRLLAVLARCCVGARWLGAGRARRAHATSSRRARAGAAPQRPPARRRRHAGGARAPLPRLAGRGRATCARCAWRASAAPAQLPTAGAAARAARRSSAPGSGWAGGCARCGRCRRG